MTSKMQPDMSDAMPLISIIMPVRNGATFLKQSMESVKRAASHSSVEVIAIDDASTDETPVILNRYAESENFVKFRSLPSRVGPGRARNEALEMAQGEFIGFLDADDLFLPGALDTLRQPMRDRKAIEVVMGRVRAFRSFHESGESTAFRAEGPAVRIYQLGSILARRSAIERMEGFDPRYIHGEDIDLFLKLQEANTEFALLDDVVLMHRRHADNMSSAPGSRAVDMAQVMRASLNRRRRLAERERKSTADYYYIRPDSIDLDA